MTPIRIAVVDVGGTVASDDDNKQRMTTIDEIARLAGVSPATVSKVLNNRPYVSDLTRARIERVIAETGFVPSQRARGLSQRRSYILGLLIPYTSDELFADPHLLEIMRGIEAETNCHEYNLLLSTSRAALDAVSACLRMLRSDVIDGAIMVETLDILPYTDALSTQAAPWVMIGYPRQGDVRAVHADDYGGALLATRHLINLGHRHIAVITSTPRPFALEERLRGVRDALATSGLPLDERLLLTGDFSIESGERAGAQLLALPEPPSAVFALNDRMALGVIRSALAHGKRVPEDLSVVGFDDIALASLLNPALTTVRQPGFAMGQAAARGFFALLDGQPFAVPTVIPTELIVRGTSGKA
ncbi:LacI family transcriptional regulator [Candidatus Gracilibacteria bacterium]|nr:LacI family transcriptional regulator [Candidatus Gracilibacteria bacterium]